MNTYTRRIISIVHLMELKTRMNKNNKQQAQAENNTLSLPIVVKEAKTTLANIVTCEVATIKDEAFEAIIAESISDEEKLAKIREAYGIKVGESLMLTEDITKDNADSLIESSIPVLKEWNLSWAGKLFFAGAAAYIAGKVIKNMPLKLHGSKEQLRAIADAIVASKAFQDELKKPGASIESVVKKMNLRNVTRQRFEQLTGKAFPL